MDNGEISKVAVAGEQLGFRTEGTGPTVLAIGSTGHWPGSTFSPELRKKLKFILADSRFCASPRPLEEVQRLTLETLCKDADLIRQASGEEQVVAMGHSAIGLLALEYARLYPQSVTHVLMIGTPPRKTLDTTKPEPDFIPELKQFWREDASQQRKALLRQNQAELTPERMSQVPPGKAFGVWYIAHGPMAFYDPAYNISWMFEGLEFDTGVYGHFVGTLLKDYNVEAAIREVSVPVFLALGRYDYLVPFSLWDADQKAPPNLTVKIYDKSGHYPMMEESQLFDQDLLNWLGGEV